ncbi:hypothetical protein [Lacipirellula sp.]|uniref:hypothetical protein n=1 Tax=Lacipirellula sp. TaxID=2691419 RepID=UPI003D0E9592
MGADLLPVLLLELPNRPEDAIQLTLQLNPALMAFGGNAFAFGQQRCEPIPRVVGSCNLLRQSAARAEAVNESLVCGLRYSGVKQR